MFCQEASSERVKIDVFQSMIYRNLCFFISPLNLVNTTKIMMEKFMHLLLTSSRHLSHYICLIRLFTTCNSTKLLQIQAIGTLASQTLPSLLACWGNVCVVQLFGSMLSDVRHCRNCCSCFWMAKCPFFLTNTQQKFLLVVKNVPG